MKERCYASHMRKYAFLGCAILLAASAALAQVYRWVDEDGVVHYADTPHPGAEEVYLPETPAAASPSPVVRRRQPAQSSASPDGNIPFRYESLTVASPAPEATLWNIGGILNVSLQLQPTLQSGHRVRVYFDGEPQAVSSLTFELQEVWRGTHNLQAEIVNETGELMIRSEPSRFYVQQTSIVNPGG